MSEVHTISSQATTKDRFRCFSELGQVPDTGTQGLVTYKEKATSEYSASCLTRINDFRKHPGALFSAYKDFRPSADLAGWLFSKALLSQLWSWKTEIQFTSFPFSLKTVSKEILESTLSAVHSVMRR